MRTILARSIGLSLGITLLLFAAVATARADDAKLLATGPDRIAIQGYDTVAYFTDDKAIRGSSSFEYVWGDARWRFASLAHRDMFIADPDHYAPQFGGFCAGAIVSGELVPANPESWTIVDGKLYMVSGSQADLAGWKADAANNVKRGDQEWPVLQARAAAQNQ
jgi:hypothetical protein